MNIGKILGFASSQHIILRSIADWSDMTKAPVIGDAVYDMDKKRVGTIHDIFGPVKKPFVSVQPMRGSSQNLENINSQVGASLFTLPSKPKSPMRSNGKSSFSKPRSSSNFSSKPSNRKQHSKFNHQK